MLGKNYYFVDLTFKNNLDYSIAKIYFKQHSEIFSFKLRANAYNTAYNTAYDAYNTEYYFDDEKYAISFYAFIRIKSHKFWNALASVANGISITLCYNNKQITGYNKKIKTIKYGESREGRWDWNTKIFVENIGNKDKDIYYPYFAKKFIQGEI